MLVFLVHSLTSSAEVFINIYEEKKHIQARSGIHTLNDSVSAA